jgi:hypothetical protein
MVMHVTSYDVMVGVEVLYPLGVTIDFWEKTADYHPKCKIGISCKVSLLVRFVGGQVGKSNKFTMLFRFSSLAHGFGLLEGNIHDQDELPNGELAMSGP